MSYIESNATIYLDCNLFKFLYFKHKVKSRYQAYFINRFLSVFFYILSLILLVTVERSVYAEGDIEADCEPETDSQGLPTELGTAADCYLTLIKIHGITPFFEEDEILAASIFNLSHQDFEDKLEEEILYNC